MLFFDLFKKPVRSDVIEGVTVHVPERHSRPAEVAAYINRNIRKWIAHNTLWDLSGYDFQHLNYNDISHFLSLVEKATSRRATLKTAFVVNSDLGYGVTRMFLSMAEGREVKLNLEVYRSREDALEWLRE